MNRNLESPTQLTEFAPLSPEPHQPAVGLFLSRIFKFNRGGSPPESAPAAEGGGKDANVPPWGQGETTPSAPNADISSAPASSAAPPAAPFVAETDYRLPNVLRRMSSLLALNSSGLQAYKDSDFKQYWMPDSVSKECYDCGERFTTFRRRHHCRICGQIFCARCCRQEIPGKIMGCSGALRVCNYCSKVVLSYLQSADVAAALSADLRALSEDLRVRLGPGSGGSGGGGGGVGAPTGEAGPGASGEVSSPPGTSGAADCGAGDGSAAARARRASHQEDRFGARGPPAAATTSAPASQPRASVPQLSAEERSRALRRSSSLRALHAQLTRSPNALPVRPAVSSAQSVERTLLGLRSVSRSASSARSPPAPGSFSGAELVDWLRARGHAASRAQASALAQALLDGGFLENASPVSPSPSSGGTPSPSSATSPGSSSNGLTVVFEDGPAAYRPLPAPPPPPPSPPAKGSRQGHGRASSGDSQDAWGVNDSLGTDSESECPAFDDDDEGVCNGVSSGNGNSNSSGGGPESSGVSEEVSPSASDGDRSLPSSGSTFYLDLNVEAGAVALSRPRPPPTATSPPPAPPAAASNTNSAPRPRPPDAPPAPAPPAAQDADEQAARLRLEEAYAAHEALLLRQLLRAEGLSAQWEGVLLPLLAAAADAVRADPYADMDVRKYVQMKKVSGGRRSDSRLVRGVVCSKNVAHRAMPRRLENARVLCVGGAIAFQRVEGRLQSLEPLLLGEREYLRHVVARLVAQNPSLVLVARGVARPAQELLLSAGVALALNVKPSVVERVARCTGAHVLESADAQLARPRLGLARLFHLSTFRRASPDAPSGDLNEPPPKTLMFLEGCKRERLGATVLLRGGSDAELARVKRVARLTLLARYGGRLEREFLLAEGARPPSPPAAPRFAAQDDDEEDEGPCRPASPVPVATSSPTPRTCEESVEESLESEHKLTKEVIRVAKEKEIKEKEEISEILLTDNSNESSKSEKEVTIIKEELELKNDAKHEAKEEDQNNVQRPDSQGVGECEEKMDSIPEAPMLIVGQGDDNSGSGIAGSGSKALQAVTLRPRAPSGRQDRSPGDDRRSGGGGSSSTCTEAVSDFSDPLRCAAHDHPLSAPSAPGPPSAAPTPAPPVPPLSVATLPRDNRFREALAGTLLSGSPFLQFPVPRLETEAGRASALWRYLPRDLFWSAQFHPAGDGPTSSFNPAPSSVPALRPRSPQLGEAHPFVRARLTCAASTREVQAMLAHFRACGGRLPQPAPCPAPAIASASDGAAEDAQMQPIEPALPAPSAALPLPPPDALDPRNHQHLAVLYCSYALTHNAAPAYCLAPWVVHMDLYDSTSDMSLDRFLLRHCFPDSFDCPSEECDAPLLHHVRRFVHDGVCLTLSLSPAPRTLAPAPSQGESSAPPAPPPVATDDDCDNEDARIPVLAWSWCARCQAASPAVPLSADARALSFAKFLELRFHAPAYRRRSASACTHALHRDHVLCLARAGVVASFRYSQIQQWEVALPPPEVALGAAPGAAPQQRAAVIEELKQLALRGYELFSAVLDRLCALQAHIDVNALKAALAREKASYKTRIEEIQLRLTSPTLETRRLEAASGAEPATQAERDVQVLMWPIEDSLVCLKRGVADAVEAWNTRLLDAAAAAARRRDAPAAASGVSVAPPAAPHPTPSAPPAAPVAPGAERPVSPAAEAGATTPSPPPEAEDQLSAEERAALHPEGAMLPEVEGGAAHGVVLIQPNDVPEATGPASRPSSVSDADVLASSEVPDAGGSGSGVGSRGSASGRPLGVKSLLTQLLAGGGAGPALQSPLAPTEHPLAGPGWVPPVVIYEGEPSSVVAAALASPEYRRSLDELRRVSVTRTSEQSQPSPLHKRRSGGGGAASSPSPVPGAVISDGSTASALGAESSSSAAAGTSSSVPLPLGAGSSGSGSGTAGTRRAGVLSFLRGNSGSSSSGGGGGVGGGGSAPRVDGVAYHRPLSIGSDQTTAAATSGTGGPGSDASTAGVTPKDDDITASVGSGGGGGGGGSGAGGSSVSQHVEVTLSEGGALFFCRAYFAPAFAALRERLLPGGEEAFARSLTRCVHWAARGGKSGSAFCKTRDDRFVLKEMSRMEMQLFLDFANHYFAHVHSSLSANRAMLLGKIVGVYRIKVRSASGSTMSSNLLVMENLFFRRHVTHKFDLKGSMRNRLAETLPEQGSANGELVLLDENLLKMTCDSPLYVYPHSKAVLMQAIHNDTQFLAAQDVMDYSLLVGLDEDRHELVVGIIDYIRTFTWDKKLEAMVKYYGGLGGGQARLPTVVSPELYRSRFVKAMHQYFLPVPDRWTHLGRGLMEGAY